MKFKLWLLLLVFLLGFIVRLYRIDNPVADWHAFRQSDTNAVSQIFARDGINLIYPKYFDISNVQSGSNNPEGYRFVELPIYNALQASLFNLFNIIPLEVWGRLITIFASLSTGLFIYLLTRKYAGELTGIFSLIFYLFLPYSIFYGRTILPDPSMTASIMAGIYFFDLWIEKIKKPKYFGLAVLFTALAFLLKPFALFFTLPMVYLAWKKFGFKLIKKWQLWLFGILSLAPIILWRVWISQFPEGVPASEWLLNSNNIRFRPAFFRWIFFERITKLILGYAGILFVAIGGIRMSQDFRGSGLFFLSFALSSLFYVTIFATGNVQHDYYQILIIPTIVMFAGIGMFWLYSFVLKKTNKIAAGLVSLAIIIISFHFSWIQVRDYFNINDRGMVAAGQQANEILPSDAIIIAPHDGSTTLLNISARQGWPVFQLPIEELIDRGATHLVIANPTKSDFEGFGNTYERLAESEEYLILELKK